MSKLTTLGLREVFDNARQLLVANGYNVQAAKLTQSSIRSEVLMSANSSRFHLPVVVNDQTNGAAFPTEKRLQLQDVFITMAIAMYVAKPSGVQDGGYPIFTYPNLREFAAANTARSIRGVYSNANLSMVVDNDQTIPYFPTDWLYRAPVLQEGVNVGYTASGNSQLDSRDGSNDGIILVEPNLILAGNAQIDFNLNLPSAMVAIESNSRFIVIQYGLLAQNCSKIAN